MSSTQRTTDDSRIDWPAGYDRTDSGDRESYPGDLSVTRKQAFESIVDELEHWGKTDVQIDSASQHYADWPNIPHQHDKPDDVGVVAYYRDPEGRADEQSAIACDQWSSQRENARAISLWVRRIRLANRCGVETARDIDEVAQLPPADGEAIAAPVPPHEVLDVAPDATAAEIREAYREKVVHAHPDQGGSDEEFYRLEKAREAMLDD